MSDEAASPSPTSVKSALSRIDAICDRFEQAWKGGGRPEIEEFLTSDLAPESCAPRRQLLVELVIIDLEYRWRTAAVRAAREDELTEVVTDRAARNEATDVLPAQPTLEDYVARYPELGPRETLPDDLVAQERRVRQRWGEAMVLVSGGTNHMAHLAGGVEDFKGTKRFVVEQRIGAGGMGVVYRAFDRERKEIVAIKTVRSVEARTIYRLKREFRSLADMVHTNLVRLHELFSVGGRWFFTMEFVEGVDFFRYVRSGVEGGRNGASADRPSDGASTEKIPAGKLSTVRTEPVRVEAPARPPASQEGGGQSDSPPLAPPTPTQLARLRRALRQVAEGVFVLHQAGKLHRDIKPSNVLVTHDGRVVLLDFGLTTELEQREQTATTGYNVVGSVAYMSPEQAAGTRLSPASDWYSVGVMLYEALTGRQPFQGRPLDVLTGKQERDPAPPTELVAGIPQDLNWLCIALLRRDPSTRPSGAEVLRRLGSTSADEQAAPYPARSSRQSPFVGREELLNTLSDAFRVMKRGRTVAAYVHGRPGVGKTAFVQRYLDQIRRREDTVVLAGRCYECESVPYKALDSLVDAMSHYLVRLPRLEVEALLPRDVEALAQAFPVLRRVEAVAESRRLDFDAPDRHELRQRAFDGLRELLARLG
ncbi:MAG: serine/threonine-protein kinase, partial [Planctomycetota bacterium]